MWNLRNVPSSSLQYIRKFEEFISWLFTRDIWSIYCKLHRRGANCKFSSLTAASLFPNKFAGLNQEQIIMPATPSHRGPIRRIAAENQILGWSMQFIWAVWFTPVHFPRKKRFTPVRSLLCANASFINIWLFRGLKKNSTALYDEQVNIWKQWFGVEEIKLGFQTSCCELAAKNLHDFLPTTPI